MGSFTRDDFIRKSSVNPPFFTEGYYHIYNRGVEKRDIFSTKSDYLHFLEGIDYYRRDPLPVKFSDFRRGNLGIKKIETQIEIVRVYCYCLMPNHFHLLVQQLSDGGITQFMRKFLDSHTRYFNTKHERVGPLFQGRFKAKLIETEEYLLQLSKYIHRNSFLLPSLEGRVYPYSSYGYYLSGKKHPFCNTNFISSYFSKTNPKLSYQSFMEDTEIRGIERPEFFESLIDFDE